VVSVGLDRSQVVLLGDPSCKVSAVVNNPTQDSGIVGTSGTFDGSLVEMQHMSRTADLKPGQVVLTSGMGEIFPRGIPIGRIVDSRLVDFGSSTEARVKLGANLSALDEIWVLFP
jgi:rod shape-determining protein MreC